MTTLVQRVIALLSIVAVHIGLRSRADALPIAIPSSSSSSSSSSWSSSIKSPHRPSVSSSSSSRRRRRRRASSSAMEMASSPRQDVDAHLLGRDDAASSSVIVPPPPPLSMPVWSFSCAVPFRMTGRSPVVGGGGRPHSSSMSIVTYAIPGG